MSGVLDKAALVGALTASSLSLSPTEINALLSAAETQDGGKTFFYESLAYYAYYILQYLAQSAMM